MPNVEEAISLLDDFILRVLRLEEMHHSSSNLLSGYQQELEKLRRPPLDESSSMVKELLKSISSPRAARYQEASCHHVHSDRVSLVKLNGFFNDLKEHISGGKNVLFIVLLHIDSQEVFDVCPCGKRGPFHSFFADSVDHELLHGRHRIPWLGHATAGPLLGNANSSPTKLKVSPCNAAHSLMEQLEKLVEKVTGLMDADLGLTTELEFVNTHLDEDKADIEQMLCLEEPIVVPWRTSDYAILMSSILSMLEKDLQMQELVVTDLSIDVDSDRLQTYTQMWSLRPFIDDALLRQTLGRRSHK